MTWTLKQKSDWFRENKTYPAFKEWTLQNPEERDVMVMYLFPGAKEKTNYKWEVWRNGSSIRQ